MIENVKLFREIAVSYTHFGLFSITLSKTLQNCRLSVLLWAWMKNNTKFCSKYVLIIWAYFLLIIKLHFKVDSNNELIINDLHSCCCYLPLINYVCFQPNSVFYLVFSFAFIVGLLVMTSLFERSSSLNERAISF